MSRGSYVCVCVCNMPLYKGNILNINISGFGLRFALVPSARVPVRQVHWACPLSFSPFLPDHLSSFHRYLLALGFYGRPTAHPLPSVGQYLFWGAASQHLFVSACHVQRLAQWCEAGKLMRIPRTHGVGAGLGHGGRARKPTRTRGKSGGAEH